MRRGYSRCWFCGVRKKNHHFVKYTGNPSAPIAICGRCRNNTAKQVRRVTQRLEDVIRP